MIPNSNFKYEFDQSSKKFICPECKKKRFVRLVNANGDFLPEIYGKCDRIIKCKYQRFPIENELDLPKIKIESKPESIPSFIDEIIVQRSMRHYEINPYYKYLCSLFSESKVLEALKLYRVGTSRFWNGAAIFWQTDLDGKVRSGKIMSCNPLTGKRISKPTPVISWAHKALQLKDFNLKQVLFGLHLISEDSSKVVCVVESEKTALIMSLFCPDYIWLSTGSLVQFNYERISPLKGRQIIVYPDSDAHEKWVEKAEVLSAQIQTKIYVSELLIERISKENYDKGLDLADVIKFNDFDSVSATSPVQVISEEPVIIEMVKKFDLFIESIS